VYAVEIKETLRGSPHDAGRQGGKIAAVEGCAMTFCSTDPRDDEPFHASRVLDGAVRARVASVGAAAI